MAQIHTWADGYGLWWARVPNTPDAHKVAERAIMAELRQREKTVSHVTISAVRGSSTAETVVYVEDDS
jgi:hypothetical protein